MESNGAEPLAPPVDDEMVLPLASAPISAGARAPDFALPYEGGVQSLEGLIAAGPALLVFFKTTCGSSQIALGVYGEIERRYGDALPVVTIAQDPIETAEPWLAEQCFTGRVLIDHPSYEVSAGYGLEALPTAVLVGRDGVVLETLTGWSRDAINSLTSRIGRMMARDEGAVSSPDDGRIAFRPG